MAEVIRMPRMSDTMTEGVIVSWLKKVGETIQPGDILAEVETDKATMELESYQEGTLLYVGVKKGDAIPVDAIIAIVGEKGEDFKSLLAEAEKPQEESSNKHELPSNVVKSEDAPIYNPAPKKMPQPNPLPAMPAPSKNLAGNGRIKASPLAKKLATERGIDISRVTGTGEDGRIVKRDIEAYKPTDGQAEKISMPGFVSQEKYSETGISQMRKTIARRLSESKFNAPHFYLTIDLDMDKTIEGRKSINDIAPQKISFNDLIIKAAALALRMHPAVNASWLEDRIRYNDHIHIGMAVAIDEGLIVPVIKFADTKSLSAIASEAKTLGSKAKNKQLQPPEFEGNTFTISNLGMFGIEEFTAIINPPDACIMAVGSIREVPAVANGKIKVAHKMKVTLSCDHRVVDGATGAKFLQTFRLFMEDPVKLLAFSSLS